MVTFDEFLKQELDNDKNFRIEYERLQPEFCIIQALIDARKKSGLTQKELAEKTGIAQGDISKMERGVANPSVKTLQKLAKGMDAVLRIEFVPISEI